MSRSDWSSVFLSSVRLFVRACQPAKPAVGGRIFFFFLQILFHTTLNSDLESSDSEVSLKRGRGENRCGSRQPEYIKLEWRRRRDEKQASSRRGDGWKCLARLHTSAFLAVCCRDRKKKEKRRKKRKKAVYWLSTLRVSLKCNHNPNWPYLLYIQAAPGVAGALLFINI